MNRGRRTNPNNLNSGFHQGSQNNLNNSQQPQQPSTPRPLRAQTQAASTTPVSTPIKAPPKPILKKEVKPAVVAATAAAAAVPVPVPVVVVVPDLKPQVVELPPTVEQMDASPEKVSESEAMSGSEDMTEENGTTRKPFFKKIFGGVRKKPSVRAKERKIRQNRHLRKVILPKNALMALYEVKGIQIGDFIINSNMEGGFTALVTVNNCQYEGTGNSKNCAKTNACEKALRDYVIKKMMQKPRSLALADPMDTSESNDATNGEDQDNNAAPDDTDDVPMVNLASYALYKLFTAWESEGYHVPEFHTAPPQPSSNNAQQTETALSKKPIGRNELPPNWEIMHPATLLCIMRPRLTYTDCGNNGDPANPIQTIKVMVDDQQFVGTGRSKKIARKNVAIAVCNSLFGTSFHTDEQ